MATVGEDGKIKGSKVTYHAERAWEAVRQGILLSAWDHTPGIGEMTDTLAYEHARGAARAARRIKR